MKNLCKNLTVVLLVFWCVIPRAFGVELKGDVNIKQVSDTAANAKIDAMNYARRQILFNVLSKYADADYLEELLQKSSDNDLMNVIVSTSVSNEQISSDAYSANIKMVLDNDAIKRWLNNQGVQNWVPGIHSGEKFTVFIVVPNGLADWAEIKRIVRDDNIDIETQSITGNQIVAKIPINYRSGFTAHIHSLGWKYTDNGGILQIWK